MKILFLVAAIIIIAGCSQNPTIGTAVSTLETRGAAVADDVLATSRFTMCRAITVGAWIRAFGSSPEQAQAWRVLCAEPITQTP